MEISVSHKFLKNFKKRFRNSQHVSENLEKRTEILRNQPNNPILKDHPLKGERADLRSFSITGDVRVTYKIDADNEKIIFLDIGAHNQVY